jgi:hypothetical protein
MTGRHRRFCLVLIKPSHYDDVDSNAVRWHDCMNENRGSALPKKMKTLSLLLLCLFLLSLFTVASLAQEMLNGEAPPGVTIRKYRWQQVGPGPSVDPSWKAESDSSSSSSSSNSDDSPSFAERRGPVFVYSLEIQNEGKKPIKAIRWNYIIFDSKTREELGTHEFESFEKVDRGKAKSLTVKSRLSPTRVVPIQVTDKSATTEQVVIKCVVYEDGTMWQASVTDRPVCEALRRRAQN